MSSQAHIHVAGQVQNLMSISPMSVKGNLTLPELSERNFFNSYQCNQ